MAHLNQKQIAAAHREAERLGDAWAAAGFPPGGSLVKAFDAAIERLQTLAGAPSAARPSKSTRRDDGRAQAFQADIRQRQEAAAELMRQRQRSTSGKKSAPRTSPPPAAPSAELRQAEQELRQAESRLRAQLAAQEHDVQELRAQHEQRKAGERLAGAWRFQQQRLD